MTECNIRLKIYDNVSNVMTRYGHTVFASLDGNIVFPPSASTSDHVMRPLPRTRAPVQNLECVACMMYATISVSTFLCVSLVDFLANWISYVEHCYQWRGIFFESFPCSRLQMFVKGTGDIISGAMSNHACIYCTEHKNDRFNMSKDETLYIVQGCVHKPLVNLPMENVIIN